MFSEPLIILITLFWTLPLVHVIFGRAVMTNCCWGLAGLNRVERILQAPLFAQNKNFSQHMTLLCSSPDLLKLQIVLQTWHLSSCSTVQVSVHKNNLIWTDVSDQIAVPEFFHWKLLNSGKEPLPRAFGSSSSLPAFLSFPKLSVLPHHPGERTGVKLLESSGLVASLMALHLPIKI